MIDATTGHEVLTFMDGSLGYNHIRMAPADEELTAFRTPKGTITSLSRCQVLPHEPTGTGCTHPREAPHSICGNIGTVGRSNASSRNKEKRVVKGQVLADFLANQPLPAEWELCDELADEDVMNVEMTPPWKMYFDGTVVDPR
ncbi:hypothetical protein LIER_03070 [Lithospermum erythrorhizon]|uniref:Gag-pol polyprotein n=1 Tax=Lithospermum erythrorhizon TaxID=34254 RepID=A0AAV3NWL5_LITER